jgi:arylsulfatase A-like enzyme/Tfp pilus assembly protein PilF
MSRRLRLLLPICRIISLILLTSALCGRCAAASKPSVVLVTLESVRADRTGITGPKPSMPNLAAFAKQAIVFENTYAQAPLTVSSHATMLSGTYPQTHGASELGSSISPGIPWVPDLLHGRGYRTAAFVGSILLDPRNGFAPGFNRGFGLYDAGFDQLQPQGSRPASTHRSGAQVVARATPWVIRNAKEPFFLWVHLNDADGHSAASYDRAISAADAALGKLISFLRAQNLYDNCVIVVAADHGESMGAHGEDTHGVFLYDETTHVPLLVKVPQNQMAGKRVKGRVRLVDIAPTILEAAAVPVPSQMQGQSLLRIAKLSPDADQSAYARSDLPQQAFGWSSLESWRSGKYLYIRAPKPELYDLSADPTATRNLAQTSKAIVATMATQLAAFDRHFGEAKAAAGGLSSSEMEKLASLGYVGLQKSGSGANTAVSGVDPKDSIALANKTLNAMLLLQQGQAEKAIIAFRQVVAGQPNIYLAQYGLGSALARQQQYKEAIEHLHRAIEVRPDSGWAQYEMGVCLMKAGDFKISAIHLEIASGRLAAFPAAHTALAQVYERLGRKEEAGREHAKASKLGAME